MLAELHADILRLAVEPFWRFSCNLAFLLEHLDGNRSDQLLKPFPRVVSAKSTIAAHVSKPSLVYGFAGKLTQWRAPFW
jgi:hypothetical protein